MSEVELARVRQAFIDACASSDRGEKTMLRAAGLVLTDLVAQGWPIRLRGGGLQVTPPVTVDDPRAEKERVRKQELVKRNAQLRHPATREFIASMEKARLFGNEFVSIFSLMRDGRKLADQLHEARKHHNNGWADALARLVDPYVEFVTEGARCRHTGLRLVDIWRYFRHGWTNPYTTVPGRGMMFLVRDRAEAFHPIIGIGALSSPIIQIRERDRWIGWHPQTVLAEFFNRPTNQLARWLVRKLDTAIDEIYVADFLEDAILTARAIQQPSPSDIRRLVLESARQRRRHHRYVRSTELKTKVASQTQLGIWETRARSHLFRSKRALAMAGYLEARALLRSFFGDRPTGAKLAELLTTAVGKKMVRKIIRKIKADRIGIAVADINVCGAVAPYNALLGGKLVSMLAASAVTAIEYKRRYASAQSEIASAMAGRPIVRPPNLVLLGTTSLYGVGSSQYNRITIPCDRLGGNQNDVLRYQELGNSEAFGTSHFSDETVAALVDLVQQSEQGQRVNSIFGEGSSPKLRKVRHGLDMLGFPSELLLRHGRHRVVYGVSLIRNLRPYLLGLASQPDYLVPIDNGENASSAIAAWWRERWLRARIHNDAVLAEVSRHTSVRPIRHGARVPAPDHSPDTAGVIEFESINEPADRAARRTGEVGSASGKSRRAPRSQRQTNPQ